MNINKPIELNISDFITQNKYEFVGIQSINNLNILDDFIKNNNMITTEDPELLLYYALITEIKYYNNIKKSDDEIYMPCKINSKNNHRNRNRSRSRSIGRNRSRSRSRSRKSISRGTFAKYTERKSYSSTSSLEDDNMVELIEDNNIVESIEYNNIVESIEDNNKTPENKRIISIKRTRIHNNTNNNTYNTTTTIQDIILLYTKAIENGNISALIFLGDLYNKQNEIETMIKYYEMATDKGDCRGCY